MEEEKCFNFTVRGTAVGFGYVYAKNEEEARKLISDGDFSDITDEDIAYDYDDVEITGESE